MVNFFIFGLIRTRTSFTKFYEAQLEAHSNDVRVYTIPAELDNIFVEKLRENIRHKRKRKTRGRRKKRNS